MTQPSPTKQYLPKEITTACPGPVRRRSPRIIAPLEIIVLPPRMMFWGPAIIARRDTLFPVSYRRFVDKLTEAEQYNPTVSMNSAFE